VNQYRYHLAALTVTATLIAATITSNPTAPAAATEPPTPAEQVEALIVTTAAAEGVPESVIRERLERFFATPTQPAERVASADSTSWVVTDFGYGNSEPAMALYRETAAGVGWDTARVAAWAPFVEAVVERESGFCPNLRRGARVQGEGTCELRRQGRGSDSGFFQLISIHYRPGAWLCEDHGICSSEQITSDPVVSMRVGLLLIDRAGRQPWCYTRSLRNGRVCRLAP
jgi:hypothetical protein